MEHYRYHKAYIPKNSGKNIRHSRVLPKTIKHATNVLQRCNNSCRTRFNFFSQNQAPVILLVKLGNAHKEELRSLAKIFRKSTPLSSTSEGTSKGSTPIKTPTVKPRNKPNKKYTPIKSIHQCITYEGAYLGGIPRGTPASAPIAKPG